jgi:hypothetical protein
MKKNRVGRLPKEESRREQEWENALALVMAYEDLSILVEDCDELHLRFQQMLHRHPERHALIVPGIERAEDMRQRVCRLRKQCAQARELLVKWKEELDK